MDIKFLKGKVCSAVYADYESNNIVFVIEGKKYILGHIQNCCEYVYIESIVGDLSDLINTRINKARESSNSGETEYGSQTWTFYKFATIKGYVDVRFHGESNGYYSESADFYEEDNIDGN